MRRKLDRLSSAEPQAKTEKTIQHGDAEYAEFEYKQYRNSLLRVLGDSAVSFPSFSCVQEFQRTRRRYSKICATHEDSQP